MAARDTELEAVEAALNTLALADTDAALEKVVACLLPGLLAALATRSSAARAKIVQTLQHINLRLRAAPSVALPFDAVLAVAADPAAALMTRNVAIQGGYVARCFARNPAQASALLPLLAAAANVDGEANRDALLALAIKALRARVHDALARGTSVARAAAAPAAAPATAALTNSSTDSSLRAMVDGLSSAQLDGLLAYGLLALQGRTKEEASNPERLALIRLCVEYAGVQQPDRGAKVFPLLLVAAGDTSREVVSVAGEDALKRIDTCDVLLQYEPALVRTLFDLLLDSRAEVPLRCLVLSKGLLRASLSASCFPEVHHVIRESVYKPGIPERLRSLGMQYISFVVANGTDASLRDNGVELLEGMLKVIRDETEGSPSFSPVVRGFAFTALAEILIRVPSILARHAHLTPELFFTAAQSATEPSQVRTAASQALSVLAPVFALDSSDPSAAIRRDSILDILRRTVQNRSDLASSARFAAVLWANQCFDFKDSSARMINIIAVGDERPDVREAALAGLSVKRFRGAFIPAPRFDSLASVSAQGRAGNDDKIVESDSYPDFQEVMTEFKSQTNGTAGRIGLELRPGSWGAFLRFALLALRHNAADRCSKQSMRKHETQLATVFDVVEYAEQFAGVASAIDELCVLADRCLFEDGASPGVKVEYVAVHVLLFMSDSFKSSFSARYGSRVDRMISTCAKRSAGGSSHLAEGLARLCGVAASSLETETAVTTVERLITLLRPESNGRASGRHGEDERVAAVLCLGYIVRSLSSVNGMLSSDILRAAVTALVCRLEPSVETSLVVRTSACSALATIGTESPLPIPLSHEESALPPTPASRVGLVNILAHVLKDDKSDAKLVEAAATAAGCLCVGEPRMALRSTTIGALLATAHLRKEDEVRFSVGESLVRASVAFDAPPPRALGGDDDLSEEEELTLFMRSGKSRLRVSAPIADSSETHEHHGVVQLDEVIAASIKLCYHARPQARAAGCVFLVTILRLIGTQNSHRERNEYSFLADADKLRFESAQQLVSKDLTNIQRAFTVLLGDRSDFSQQLASRGISLVYDLSTEAEQRELVSSLVRSLTSGKQRAATTVAGDEGGLLDINGLQVRPENSASANGAENGATGSGAATYKELCSLATDMGQPDLVYKFLDLAGHTALWNNRRGAALAGSAVLGSEFAAEQLRPHITTLIPRLYVYCYDPSEGVRMAMSSVLKSVTQASGFSSMSVAVTDHFERVAEHCLASMTSRQWRVREAGCGALRDLLASRRWSEVGRHLQEFWYIGLRAMDDIKESVRKAAEGTGRALAALSVRLCDSNLSGAGTASAAIAVIVPCILPAFTHGVKEVRVLATESLSKIIRCGGAALKPSVPDIAESLLEAATELEPVVLNYVQFHMDEDQRDRLEEARADAASMSGSPVIDSLERLSVLVDEEIAQKVVQKLVRLARNGVGVPTRAATARFFCALLSGRGIVMTPHSSKLMGSAMAAAKMEVNGAARRAWSNAFGLAARLAPVEAVASMVESIVEMSGSDSAQERALASFLALGLWRSSPETARQHGTALLPIAYMGRYEADDDARGASSNWREVWNEGSPSSEAGLRIFAREITVMCVDRLTTSSQYSVKRTSAAALGAMAAAHNSSVGSSSLALAANALVAALPGHIWDGKDAALTALGTIGSTVCNDSSGVDNSVWDLVGGARAVVSAILKESSRGKQNYRLCAMNALVSVLRGCRDLDDFIALVRPAVVFESQNNLGDDADRIQDVARSVQMTGSDAEAVDARNRARKADRAAVVASIQCLDAAFPTAARSDMQEKYLASVVDTFGEQVKAEREVRLSALEALSAVTLRSHKDLLTHENSPSKRILSAALRGIEDSKYAGVREGGYSVIQSLSSHLSFEGLITLLSPGELLVFRSVLAQDQATSLSAQKLAPLLRVNTA